ncbi:hypothetical protein CLAFUW4_09977 [Fulvia fulva]|uniref:RING-type domain-containing protein n=1 Tax=Passalora fulva TaxID=5499 RepID=A0A9Q8PH63_PASFU|nr:uncharacterized protein CLAFUR5_12266 [Fulvia fulva]KAK4616096.1 hypothetical protein CLAFUR4_09981 [Fulvia fulva]KAK4616711.1 hypothetical protein CLAFUR0_09978 [Fulvia fulva]UJO22440.1 hypothetical protein CLAFUR5_12266 [Fulvia fulva]WPV19616.1 hypothetical protein CLAFUW4_09977 [Fulvia fulva]WPV34688.1 hypothetical protein CLAFUW7_09978 [Fulvia fulva]
MLPSRIDFLNNGLVPVQEVSTLPTDDCAICTDTFTDPISLPCKHTFCKGCITQWLNIRHKNSCPTCRTAFFTLDDADRGPVGSDRIVAMGHALGHSGLLGGNYQTFNDQMYRNDSAFMRATAQANTWLAEQNHPHAAGPAVIDTALLGHHIIAMGNLLKGYARTMGRPYSTYQSRDWRNIINVLWRVLLEREVTTVDAVVLANALKEDVRVKLVMEGLNLERYFEQSAEVESAAGDFDVLLQYVVKQSAEEFARREMRRAAVREQPTVLGKVGVWLSQYYHA